MVKKKSTIYNVITLITLRYLGEEVTAKDIARWIGVSERQARTYIKLMLELGLAKKVSPRRIKIVKTTMKGGDILLRLREVAIEEGSP